MIILTCIIGCPDRVLNSQTMYSWMPSLQMLCVWICICVERPLVKTFCHIYSSKTDDELQSLVDSIWNRIWWLPMRWVRITISGGVNHWQRHSKSRQIEKKKCRWIYVNGAERSFSTSCSKPAKLKLCPLPLSGWMLLSLFYIFCKTNTSRL